MQNGNNHRRGNTLIEFTLVGIPLVFILISIFEISRGMWLYHTLAYAVREGARFAIVHGNNCNLYPNNCAVTIRDISNRIRDQAVGFVPAQVRNVRFRSDTREVACPTLEDCLKAGPLGDTYWPAGAPGSEEDVGGNRGARIEISAEYQFRSAIALFWPGASRGRNFPTFLLPASSKERIQY